MSIGIVAVMVAVAYLLSYTAVSPAHFSKPDFQGDATELDVDFRRALTVALADVTNELQFKASKTNYMNYTKLADYKPTDADYPPKMGLKFITEWQNTTLNNYRGKALNLNTGDVSFQCDWSTSEGYSICSGNVSFNIGSESFYGWKNNRNAELRVTIGGLDETDGNQTSFYFSVKQEKDSPVTGLTESLVQLLVRQPDNATFKAADISGFTYMGEGNYLVNFHTGMQPIESEIYWLKLDILNLTPDAFLPIDNANLRALRQQQLLDRMTAVDLEYGMGDLAGAREDLQQGVYVYLDLNNPQHWIDPSKVVVGPMHDTWLNCIQYCKNIIYQLNPSVKLILIDQRAISVGAYATYGMTPLGPDTTGPVVDMISETPNPVIAGFDVANLTATIRDSRSNVVSAEYFVDDNNRPWGTGLPLLPKDGKFDSPIEDVYAQISTAGWSIGSHTLYVHGKDSSGNWGYLAAVALNRTNYSPEIFLRPNGQTGQTSLKPSSSSNWQCVDETTSDEDSSYVYTTSGSSKTDLYEMQDSSIGYGKVYSVTVWIRCKRPSGTGYAWTALRTYSTSYYGTQILLTGSYVNYSTTYNTNPNTHKAWTWTEVNSIQVGVSLQKSGGSADMRCTQVWLDVHWGP